MNDKGLAFHVEGPADAPPLVLLHPIATHSEIWRPQTAAWSTAFRLVRIDLPGHGASAVPDKPLTLADYADQVCEVLDELRLERAAVVGLSLGGMVAQAMALSHARRVRALVLAHTSDKTEPAVHEIWERRFEQFERCGIEAQVEPTLERWFTRAFVRACPMAVNWVAGQIRATSAAGYATAIRAIQRLDHRDRLARITLPVLVVAGDSDTAVPPAAASAMADRIPGAELLMLKDAGHLGNVQQPLVFTEAVGRFLGAAL
ncbi:alpha/beta fold hydrolase [Piscinibacter sp. XHJ-5]|uniref:alpha/beta fold hydrolase n=1 Tax=Piscinibacter sp. XHJ-5 TaxID=3037797 RepID=UPI002452FE0F|nr:alpha/beta fold hydrolase [Piscinibacter sp. XHJ-5]